MSVKDVVKPNVPAKIENTPLSCGPFVSDANAERAEQTGKLIRKITPQLGLNISDIKVFADDTAAKLTGVHGYSGLMHNGAVYLNPSVYQASTTAGRALLAHEMVHVAQRSEWRGVHAGRNASVSKAEMEAEDFAQKFAAGHRLSIPLHILPEGHMAAQEHAAEQSSEPEPVFLLGDLGTVDGGIVDSLYKSELQRISELLGDPYNVEAEDAEYVLRILENMDIADALSVMQRVKPFSRIALVDNFTGNHLSLWRDQVITCYASLGPFVTLFAEHRFFEDMDMRNIGARTELMVVKTLGNMSITQLERTLESGDNIDAIRSLMVKPRNLSIEVEGFNQDLQKSLLDQSAIIQGFDQSLPKGVQHSGAFLKKILYLVEKGEFSKVLKAINGYAVGIDSSMSDIRRRDQQEAQRRLDYVSGEITLLDRHELAEQQRSEDDSLKRAEEVKKSGGSQNTEPPKKTQEEIEQEYNITIKKNDSMMRYIVAQLEQLGVVKQIVDYALSMDIYNDDTKPKGFEKDGFLALLRYRPADRNIELLEKLLSYAIDDWSIRDYEARFAYDVLGLMEPEAVERFKHLRGGLLYNRLIGNLPEEYIRRDDFRVIGQEGLQSILDSAPYEFLQKIINDIFQYFEDEIYLSGKDAIRGFYALARMQSPLEELKENNVGETFIDRRLNEAQKDIWRPVIVQRLDSLGQIERMLKNLPQRFLYKEENWRDLSKILVAMDPRSAQNMARDFLKTPWFSWFDWVVTDKDAFLVYQLYRILPSGDQSEFAATSSGEALAITMAEMSADMRSSTAINPYLGSDDPYARVPILEELADYNMWETENAAYVGIRVGLAVSMGYHREVYDISKRISVYLIPEFFEIIEKYKLYHADLRPVYKSLQVRGRPWYDEGVLQTIHEAGGFLAAFVYMISQAGLSNSITVSGDLDVLQTLMAGDLHFGTGGGRVTEAEDNGLSSVGRSELPEDNYFGPFEEKQGQAEERASNEFELILDLNNDVIEADIPSLDLSDIYYFGNDYKISLGSLKLSEFKFKAAFSRGNSDQVNFVELSLGSLALNEMLYTQARSAIGVGDISVSPFSLHAGGTSNLSDQQAQIRHNFINPDSLWLKIPIFSVMIHSILAPLFSALFQLVRFMTSGFLPVDNLSSEYGNDMDLMRYSEIQFGNFEMNNIVTDTGQAAGNINVEEGFVALGGNRPTYLRAQMQMIQHRIDRLEKQGGQSTEIESLKEKYECLKTELAGLAEKEDDLYTLQAMFQNSPNDFSSSNYHKMRDLERSLAMRGGVSVDIGSLQIQDVQGPMSFGDILVEDITGSGETSMAGLRMPSYARLAQEFAAYGPPNLQHASVNDNAVDAQFGFNLGTVTIKDALMEGSIPTLYALNKELAALPVHPRYDQRRAHLETIIAKTSKYEELEKRRRALARNGIHYLDEVDQEEYNRLRKDLSREFGYYASVITLENAKISLPANEAGISVNSSKVTISGVETHYGDFDGDIVLDNFNGTFSIDDKGVHVNRMTIDTITLPRFDLFYDGYAFKTENQTVLHDLFLKMSIPYNEAGELDTDRFIIHFMNIGKIDVDDLEADMEMAGSLVHINLSSGSLGNVWMKNFVLQADDAESLGTQVGVGHFSEFRVKGAMEKTASGQITLNSNGSHFNEESLSVSESAVTLDMVETAMQRIHLKDILGTDGLVVIGEEPIGSDGRPPRGSNFIRIGPLDLSTSAGKPITFHDDGRITAGLVSDEIILPQIQWFAAGGRIYSEGPVALRNVDMDVVYGGSEEFPVVVNHALIGELSVKKLLFERDDEIYGIGPADNPSDTGGQIFNIAIRNAKLNKDYMPDSFDFSINDVAEGSMRESRVDLIAQLAKNQEILSRLWVGDEGQVIMRYEEGGRHITLNAKDLYLNTLYDDTSNAGEHLNMFTILSGIDTGQIDFRDTGDEYVITIGANTQDGELQNGLSIDAFSLENMLLKSPMLDFKTVGSIEFSGINVKMDVTIPKNKAEDDVRPFSQLVIREFGVDYATTPNLSVIFRHQGEDSVNDDGETELGKETRGTLNLGHNGGDVSIFDFGLRGAKPPENFYIEPVMVDIPVLDREEDGPTKKVDWMRSIHGIFSTGAINVEEISGKIIHDGSVYRIGMNSVDKDHPDHPTIWNILDGNPENPGVYAEAIEYNFDDESVMFRNIDVSGLHLRDEDNGITLDVRKISLPKETYIYINGDAVQRQIDAGKNKRLLNVIPQIIIEDAYFKVDDLSKFLSSEDPAAEGNQNDEDDGTPTTMQRIDHLFNNVGPGVANDFGPMLDGLNGHANIDLQGIPAIGDLRIVANINNGFFHYEDFDDNTTSIVSFRLDPSTSTLHMFDIIWTGRSLVEWDLMPSEYRHAKNNEEISVVRLLHPRLSSDIAGLVDWATTPDVDDAPESAPTDDFMEILNIDVHLSSNNPNTVLAYPFENEKNTVHGSVTFDNNMFNNLRVNGDLQAIPNSGNRIARMVGAEDLNRPGGLDFSMDNLNIHSFEMRMEGATGEAGALVTTGAITLSGLKDTHITFDGYTPKTLEGHILHGEINNVQWMPDTKLKK